jgi:hypothetical protein
VSITGQDRRRRALRGRNRPERWGSTGRGLPVGIYEVKAALPGFSTVAKKDIEVAVALVQAIDFALKVVALAETVDVTGATPLVVTTSPSVGGVVNPIRIESLPLNGRQFANLAATIPAWDSVSTPTPPRAPSSRRRSTAATGATSTT